MSCIDVNHLSLCLGFFLAIFGFVFVVFFVFMLIFIIKFIGYFISMGNYKKSQVVIQIGEYCFQEHLCQHICLFPHV